MQFANRTHLSLEPGESDSFAVTATGVRYTTPTALRETLNDLARLQYVKGAVKYKLTESSGDTTGVVTVKLMSGATVLGSDEVAFDGSASYAGRFDVSLYSLGGTDPVHIEINAGTAALGGVCTLSAAIDIEHPLVIAA